MINKIYKIINNKFSGFFKFVFFLRYLFLIFFVAITLFLSIPHFFDYKKKEKIIKDNIYKNYNLEIEKIENIKFKSFPLPHLRIKNFSSKFFLKKDNLIAQELFIYPKLLSVYNYRNFKIRKIKIKNVKLELNFKDIKLFTNKIFNLKKKIYFKNLNLKIEDNYNPVIELKNMDYLNYGYNKNTITGEVFNKKFRINISENYKDIKFVLLKTGILAKINILDNNLGGNLIGNLEGQVLSTKIKLDFSYNTEILNISNFYFRDKKLSLDSEGHLKLKPFFIINLSSEIKDIDLKALRNIDLISLLKFQSLISKINSKNIIIFNPKRFRQNLVSNLQLKTNLAYGRLDIFKNIKIDNSNFICQTNINLLDEYPILYFNCSLDSPDIKKLLKKITIKYQNKKENALRLNFNGNLNILNNKINLEKIKTDNYIATEEDLIYFKTNFENIIFDKSFIDIFILSKIRKFISEII